MPPDGRLRVNSYVAVRVASNGRLGDVWQRPLERAGGEILPFSVTAGKRPFLGHLVQQQLGIDANGRC
jgi:hypothetical protein